MLERSLRRGWRALVVSPQPARLEALDTALWTYRDDSFLPHGRSDQPNPARQPVLLSPAVDPINRAQVLFALDGADPGPPGPFSRCCILFDGRDPAAVSAARGQWKAAKTLGYVPVYWQEDPNGKWEKKA
jgi:DNA polymerase-3 subunit chi